MSDTGVNTQPQEKSKRHNYPVAHVECETDGLPELIGLWRVARDLCKQHGFPDWEKLSFSMAVAFSGVGHEQVEALKQAAHDINLPIRFTEETL